MNNKTDPVSNGVKKIIVLVTLITLFSFGVTFAQETELPDPGLTPDSPFYFIDIMGKKIGMFFTFGDEKKAEKAIKYAEEKLVEAKAMAEKNKTEALEGANRYYQEFLNLANAKTKEAKEKGKDVEELAVLLTEKTLKHQGVLVEVFEQVPEESKTAIEKAIEVSREGSEQAVKAVTGAKKEELLQKIEEIKTKTEERIKKLEEKLEKTEERIRELEEKLKEMEAQRIGLPAEQVEMILKEVIPGKEKIPSALEKKEEKIKKLEEMEVLMIEPGPPVPKPVGFVTCERHKDKKGITCGDYFYKDYCEYAPDGTSYANIEVCNASEGRDCGSLIRTDRIFCAYGCQNGTCLEEGGCLDLGKEVNPSLPPEYSNLGKECCQRLKLIPVKQWFDENCNRKLIVGIGSVCAPCGNGVCDEKYENACNCPEDCLPAVAIPNTPTMLDIDVSTTAGKPYTIGWKEVSGAINYILERDTNSSFSNPVVVSSRTLNRFSETLSPSVSTRYYFRVKACNNYGCSSWSKTTMLWVEVIAPSPPPPSPSPSPSPPEEKITLNSPNGGEIWGIGNTYTIFWESTIKINGLTKVRINLLSQKRDDPSTYIVTNIASEVDVAKGFYSWQIPAKMPCVSLPCLSFSDYPCHKIEIVDSRYGRDSQVPRKISDESDNCFSIIGSCVEEGKTYMPGEAKQCCAGLKSMPISIGDGVTCSIPSGYVCTAFCGDGKCGGEYENACSCPEDCFLLEPPILTDPGTSVNKHEPFTLNWTSVKGTKRYWLQRDTSTNFSIPALYCETNSYTDNPGVGTSAPEVTTTYYYRVKACDDQRCSPWSNVVDMRIIVPISITVISPNGGERFDQGANITITWNSKGVDYLDIDLLDWGRTQEDGSVPFILDLVTNYSASKGTYTWKIYPDWPTGNLYKIRVASSDNLIKDTSNNYFSIVEGAVNVEFKNTNDTIYRALRKPGEAGIILRFDAMNFADETVIINELVIGNESANSNLQVFDENTYYLKVKSPYQSTSRLIDTKQDAPNSYRKFKVEPAIEVGIKTTSLEIEAAVKKDVSATFIGNTVHLVLSNINGYGSKTKLPIRSDIQFDSWARGEITIEKEGEKSIIVISPNGGEVWEKGNTYDITWKSSGVENVHIDVAKYDVPSTGGTIISNIPASTGKYSWTVPDLPSGDNYKIRVFTYPLPPSGGWKEGVNYDQSDSYFSIIQQP